MGVTIDSLQIEIQSSSTNAANGIDALAVSLEKLKKNGSFKTVSTNLNNLSTALSNLPNVHQASNSLRTLANSIEKLKGVGSVASLANSLKKLPDALKSLSTIDLDRTEAQLEGVARAVSPLSSIKAGGLGTMVNAMKNLGKVTESLDEKTISAFAEKVELLNQKLGPLSEKMTSIKAGFNAVNSNARKAADGVKEFSGGVDASALNLASFIEIIRTAVDAMVNLIQRFSDLIGQAIEWDGIAARFGRGFAGQASETYAWVQRLNEEMGINIQEFMQYSSVYSTMLTGFGVAAEDAGKMAIGYMELTYDIWAGYNDVYKKLEDAAEAVKSAIAGEVEPVRRAGFTIVESTLEQTAANHGLEISLANATEAQKSYLRYLTLVDQAHAQSLVGTYAKELNTAEGLTRTLAQQMKSLSQAFGSLFLPILVRVLPYVQAFVELLTEAVYWLAGLFGIEMQPVDWGGFEDGAGAIENVTNSADGAAGALDSATKAAKELKNATLGIDELNVISPSTASSSGGGAGSGSGSGGVGGNGFGGLDIDSLWDDSIFDTVQSKVSGIVKDMKEWLGITEDIDTWAELMDTRLGDILKLVGLIGGGIAAWKVSKSLIDSVAVLKELLAHPTYSITIAAIITIVGITMAYQGMEDAIENGLDGFNFAEILGGSLLTTGGVAILGSKLATWISTAFSGSAIDLAITQAGINLGVGTAGAAGAALAAGFAGIVLGIPTMFIGIYDACKDGLDWLNGLLIPAGATAGGAGIGAIIGALGGPIGAGIGALIGLAVGLVVDGIILIVENWDKITEFFSNFFTKTIPDMWNGFVEWCGGIGSFFTEDIPKFFTETIPKWGEDIAYGLGYALGKAARFIVDWWNDDVVPFFTEDIPKFFTETIPQWGENIKTAITNAFKKATQAIKDWWNNDVVPFFTNTIPRFITVDLPNFFKELPTKFKEIGKNIVDGIWSGITGAWTWLKETIGGWCDKFVQGFKDAFGIHSPSTVFAKLGTYIIDGLKSTLNVNAVKDKLSQMWTNAKAWWDGKKSALKSYTPSIGSIYDKLKERWDNARTWWNDKKTKAKEYTPSIGSIYEKLKERWDSARTWWNSKKSAMSSYTPSIGSIVDKVKSAWNSAKSWWSKNVGGLSTKLDIKVPKLTVNWGEVSALGKTFKYPKSFSVKFAANGGIFNQGSLIWAGERGPEVMATAAGGKTGVMNVQQMQDAVYDGVYAAVSAAMRGMGGSGTQAVNVYLDGRQITATVEQRQHERGASIMGNEVYAY